MSWLRLIKASFLLKFRLLVGFGPDGLRQTGLSCLPFFFPPFFSPPIRVAEFEPMILGFGVESSTIKYLNVYSIDLSRTGLFLILWFFKIFPCGILRSATWLFVASLKWFKARPETSSPAGRTSSQRLRWRRRTTTRTSSPWVFRCQCYKMSSSLTVGQNKLRVVVPSKFIFLI